MSLNAAELERFVNGVWDQSIVAELCEYVRIPNKSPLFDPDWERHGHMERAVALMADWASRQPVAGLRLRIARLPGRTPLIFMEVPGQTPETVLFYGHLDKQPEFTGWQQGLGPWEPVIRDGRLYGRGAADDGYAIFSSLTAIAALQAQKIPHARCVAPDRGVRGERERRFACARRRARRRHREPEPRGLSGCRGRRLRAAVAHHVAARKHRGHARDRRAHRGRAFGRGQRYCGVLCRCAAHSVVATIRFRDGRAQARRARGRSARR